MGAEGVVTIDGCLLSVRTWALIQAAWAATGLPGRPRIAQGSWHDGSLSGGTHSGGGAFDLRVINVPADQREPLVVNLRARNADSWLRDKAHGWLTGDHIHGIVRDEPDLSEAAQWQVAEYDRGHDGLSSRGPDYHPRPEQFPLEHFTEADVPLTPAEIQAVADAVWAKQLVRAWDGKDDSAGNMLGSTQRYAIEGGFDGLNPKGNVPTVAKRLLHPEEVGAPVLADADVERIALRVADLLAERLST